MVSDKLTLLKQLRLSDLRKWLKVRNVVVSDSRRFEELIALAEKYIVECNKFQANISQLQSLLLQC